METTTTQPTTLPLSCPNCGRALKRAPLMRYATQIRTRTCGRCRARYSIKLAPKCRPGAVLTTATYTLADPEAMILSRMDLAAN